MLEPKYKCGICDEVYETENGAIDCWRDCVDEYMDVREIWTCPICHDELRTEKEAMECHDYDPDAPPSPLTMAELEALGQVRLLP